jgi:hypothetical protein
VGSSIFRKKQGSFNLDDFRCRGKDKLIQR